MSHTAAIYDADPYYVVVSETGTDDSFEKISPEYQYTKDAKEQMNIDIPEEYAGKSIYIGFLHEGYNGEGLIIDDIKLTGAPQNLVATPGETSVVLSWDAVATATSYKVYIITDAAGLVELAEVTEPTYTNNYLEAGTEYTFYVTAVNAIGEGGAAEVTFTTTSGGTQEPDEPETPVQQYRIKSVATNKYLSILDNDAHPDGTTGGVIVYDETDMISQIFTIEDATDGYVYLHSTDDKYIVCRQWNVDACNNTDKSALEMIDAGNGTFYLTDPYYVANKSSNYFKIQTVGYYDYVFCDAASADADLWTLEQIINDDLEPAVPANLTATVESYNTISLAWDEAENAVKYNVYKDGEFVAETQTTSYTVTGLAGDTEYTFTVTGVRGEKESEHSEAVKATTEVFKGCYVVFTLEDGYYNSYGASWGWSGTQLTISYGEVTETLTLWGNDAASRDYILAIPTGEHVTVTFGAGSYDASVVSFAVKYEGGAEIYTAAQGTLSSSWSTTFEFDVDCTPKAPAAPVVIADVTETTIILSWNEVGGATSYNVYQGTEAIATNLTETTYVIEDLTTGTEYCYNVTAVNEIGESEPTEVCATPDYAVIVNNGENTGYAYLPTACYYNYAFTQQIYTAEDINLSSCDITKIAFYQESAVNYTRNLNIYMMNTDKESFEHTTDWVAVTEDYLVYSGNITTTGNAWLEIELANKFSYEGGNVLLCVQDVTANYTNDFFFSVYATSDVNRAIAWCNDYGSYDVNGDLSAYEGTPLAYVNKLKLNYEPVVAPALAAPQNLVATVEETTVTLTWDAVEGAESYVVYKDEVEYATVTEATAAVEGVSTGLTYCFTVKAVAGEIESELSEKTCVEVPLADDEIVVDAEETNTYYSPFLTILKDSYEEIIYKAEEIGQACTINELAFLYDDGKAIEADITIYFAETAKDEFASADDFAAESELKLVYSGTGITLCDNEWESFTLDTPFEYGGENNLLVVVATKTSVSNAANKWVCYDDPSTVLIRDLGVDSNKPVVKFTLGEGGETPVGPEDPYNPELEYRLLSVEGATNTVYTYESEYSTKVIAVNVDGIIDTLYYNDKDQIVKVTSFIEGEEEGTYEEYSSNEYTYNEAGQLVTFSEYIDFNGGYNDVKTLSYDDNGKLAQVLSETEKTEYVYDENGVLAEKVVSFVEEGTEYPFYKEIYTYENGNVVKVGTAAYYEAEDETEESGWEVDAEDVYEYDAEGNCVSKVSSEYGSPWYKVVYAYGKVPAENVYYFAYPHEVLNVTPVRKQMILTETSYYGDFTEAAIETIYRYEEVAEEVVVPETIETPANLVAAAAGATAITLTWDAVEGAESYNVYSADTLVANVAETTYEVENLKAETEYCFTVTAVKGELESEESAEACATTDPDGIAENAVAFNVYPNPADDVIFVEAEANIESVSVYNVLGVMVYSEQCTLNNVQLNIADYSAGVYFVKVRTANAETVSRIVKK